MAGEMGGGGSSEEGFIGHVFLHPLSLGLGVGFSVVVTK